MAFAYTIQERADLNAKASALLNTYPDVGSFIRQGLCGNPDTEALWKAALLQSTTIVAGAKIRTTAVACRPFAHCHHACAFASDQEAYLSTLYPLHLAQPVTRDTRRSVSVRDRSVVERAIH